MSRCSEESPRSFLVGTVVAKLLSLSIDFQKRDTHISCNSDEWPGTSIGNVFDHWIMGALTVMRQVLSAYLLVKLPILLPLLKLLRNSALTTCRPPALFDVLHNGLSSYHQVSSVGYEFR
jgi:hypothetical protein